MLTIVLMTALSSQAFAYFTTNDLIAVVYNQTNEEAIDLGSITNVNIDTLASPLTLAAAGSINLAGLQATSYSQLQIGLFAFSGMGTLQEYFATTQTTAPALNSKLILSFSSAFTNVTGYYSGLGTSSIEYGAPTNRNSYFKQMDGNGNSPGFYAGLNTAASSTGESSLAALDTGGSVAMYLYHFNVASAAPGANTPYYSILQINSDGSIVAEAAPATTPIPASILLFGSGLFGLLGIRRKITLPTI